MDEKNKSLLERAKKDNVRLVELHFTDIFGAVKSVTMPRSKLGQGLEEGIWFDGSSIEGFARIAESDMYLKPDASTYAVIPWKAGDANTARMIADVYMPNGKPFAGDPRFILRKALEEAKKMGFGFNVGPELEFFFLQKGNDSLKPVPHDAGGYFDFAPKDLASDVRRDIIFALEKLGFEVETSHHEVAPGQHEIDFRYSNALKQADNVVTFKYAAKCIAGQHGLNATFMPKPIFGECGSGMHVHQSLYDIENGKNAFHNAEDEYGLSETAKHFIAGQLAHAKALSAIVAPTVNSYKRLVPNFEAPVYICWGRTNRSALIRIPRSSQGSESTRAELRCPDPSANPYLAFAAMLTAGLDGVKKKIVLPDAVEGNVYEFDHGKLEENNIGVLPKSLSEAIGELENDTVILDALGEHAKEKYLYAKKKEWEEYRTQVTDWELEQYL